MRGILEALSQVSSPFKSNCWVTAPGCRLGSFLPDPYLLCFLWIGTGGRKRIRRRTYFDREGGTIDCGKQENKTKCCFKVAAGNALSGKHVLQCAVQDYPVLHPHFLVICPLRHTCDQARKSLTSRAHSHMINRNKTKEGILLVKIPEELFSPRLRIRGH